MKRFFCILIASMILILNCSKNSSDNNGDKNESFQTADVVLTKIQRGINIGNTLEPPTEGEWNNGPLQEYYFDDYKSAGFNVVRIPVRWEQHVDENAPYLIDGTWLNRIEEVVDWGLKRDLYLIINAHHDWWLVNNYADENIRNRFDSIWQQISERFKNKSPRLMFEIINEPNGLTQDNINELNARILAIIRESNPRRIVIYSGHGWANAEQMMSAAVPDDDYVMAYYHSYDPWDFAGQANGSWGTTADINAVTSKFQSVALWSVAHSMPVMISEFGALVNCPYNSRMLFYYTYVEQAVSNNIAFMSWDDGGGFGIYDRENRQWSDVKDILIHTWPEGPALLQASLSGPSTVSLSWQNNSADYNECVVQRKSYDTEFTEITRLAPGISSYNDTVNPGTTYYYRVIYDFTSGEDMYSNPVQVIVQ